MRYFGFIGVSTAESAIMAVFPEWAKYLDIADVEIRGHDLPLHAAAERYRALVGAIKADPGEIGALVTSHKIDLLEACRDQFDYLDPLAELCGEVSAISKRDGRLRGHALDPISSGRALGEFLESGYFSRTRADVLLFGAGGADSAISLHLLHARPPADRPRRLIVVDLSAPRLSALRTLHERLDAGVEVTYVNSDDARVNDRLLGELAPGSLVVNGTGMGKDRPGSPLSDDARFPKQCRVWELNYRGALDFLHQALRQQAARDLVVEDGWRYFIHGWTCAMEEVFEIEMSVSVVDALSQIAREARERSAVEAATVNPNRATGAPR